MRNFIIFFTNKEGSSPLVRLMDNFERISIIHQVDNAGWEPFDRHNCGPMPLDSLEQCLDIVFSEPVTGFQQLNQIYTRTSARPLQEIGSGSEAVGFKMRFRPPVPNTLGMLSSSRWGRLAGRKYGAWRFRHMMIDLLRRNDVVVFITVRQDVFRWGLSKYHGDGTGKRGHLQFKLATGEIKSSEIEKIHVDCTRLGEIIKGAEKTHDRNRRLLEELERAGIQAHPLLYEDFLNDKQQYFSEVMDHLGLGTSQGEIEAVLKQGAYFRKVHSDEISDFVENYEEVQEKFGDRYVSWR